MIAKLGHRTNVRYGTHADMSPLPIVRPLLCARNQGSKNALWPYCERSRERMLSYGSISRAGEAVLHSAGEKRARRAPPPPSVFDDPFSRFSRQMLEFREDVPRLPEGRTAPKWRLPGLFPGCVTRGAGEPCGRQPAEWPQGAQSCQRTQWRRNPSHKAKRHRPPHG